jgi:DNA (cytosine-5)-methyltransferase 1
MVENQPITVLSMFSGIGGLDMGFSGGFSYMSKHYEPMGFNILAAYEKDKRSVETFNLNHSVHAIEHEITIDSIDSMPSADMLIGGFPCQDFSSCGPRLGLDSDRGKLYRVM